jgi:hypothetical protein
VAEALAQGLRTPDIAGSGKFTGTAEAGATITALIG